MKLKKIWDVAVIGAGPAGSTASYHLSRSGYEVLLLDKEDFPRYKPCGGALSRKVKRFLPVKYDSIKGDEIFGAEFSFKGSDSFRIETQDFIAKLIHREDFDNELLNLAIDNGANFRGGERVIGIREYRNALSLDTANGITYSAKFVIGADGPRGISARFLNPRHYIPMGIAIEEEMGIEELVESKVAYLDFGRFPWGYGWIFPKEGLSSVGCGAVIRRKKIPLADTFKQMKNDFGLLKDQGRRKMSWLLPYFGSFPYRIARDRLLLAGDAARFMDPFLGEGIYYALASGTLAAESVQRSLRKSLDAVTTYLQLVEKEIIAELKHAAQMADFVYPRLKLGYNTLKRSKKLGFLYVDVMSGDLSYREFNKGLFRSMKEVGRGKFLSMLFKNRRG